MARSRASFFNIEDSEPEHLDRGVAVGDVAAALAHFLQLIVQRFESCNKEIEGRTNVVGISRNPPVLLRPAGAVFVEQHDEWEAGTCRLSLRELHVQLDVFNAALSVSDVGALTRVSSILELTAA